MRIDRYTQNPDSDQDLKKHNQLINQTMDNSQNPVEAPKQLNNFSAVNDRKPAKKKKKRRALIILLVLILILAALIAGIVAYSYKSAMDSLSLTFDYTPQIPESGSTQAVNDKDSDNQAESGTEAESGTAQNVLHLEVGGKYPALDFVSSSEGDVVPAAEYLESDTTGDREMVYTVSKSLYGGLLTPAKEFTLRYSVEDTEPPVILWNGSGTVLQRGTDFDINEVFGYGDNADPAPQINVDGKVYMDTAGRYSMHITLTDASGNSTESDLYVDVADPLPAYTDNYARTKFSSFARKYKGTGRSFGIDVSTWQRDIDFEAVKAAGCDFVIIRVGYSDDGTLTEDSYFRKNLKNAKAAGLKVGLYMYSYDNSEEEVRRAADKIIELLGEETLDLPIAFDWEDFGHFQKYRMSFATLNSLYDAFAEELATGGYDCMLYSSRNFLDEVWAETDTRPVWLAHYTDKTDYKGPYMMWQASNTGRISGIEGDVDLDILYD